MVNLIFETDQPILDKDINLQFNITGQELNKDANENKVAVENTYMQIPIGTINNNIDTKEELKDEPLSEPKNQVITTKPQNPILNSMKYALKYLNNLYIIY